MRSATLLPAARTGRGLLTVRLVCGLGLLPFQVANGQNALRLEPESCPVHYATAIAGNQDVIAVGGTVRDAGLGPDLTHVFRRIDGHWTAEQELEGGGWSLASSGDIIVAGTYANVSTGALSSAKVFRHDGSRWELQGELAPGNRFVEDDFGRSVAVDGAHALVGATGAHMFRIDGQELSLVTDFLTGEYGCGRSVSLSRDVAVVGCQDSVIVFRDVDGAWKKEAKLTSSDGSGLGTFGRAVSVTGDTIAVGEPWADHGFFRMAGAVHVFAYGAGRWTRVERLVPHDVYHGDEFGTAIALLKDRLVVGARYEGTGSPGLGPGAVYEFHLVDGVWVERSKVTPPDGGLVEGFGVNVTFVEAGIVVASVLGACKTVERVGAAFVFEQVPTSTSNAETLTKTSLFHSYPNPVSAAGTVSYSLPRAADVTLTVYDLLGREVRELASGTQPAGTYEVTFDATELPSGVYFYRLEAGEYVEARRMVIVR